MNGNLVLDACIDRLGIDRRLEKGYIPGPLFAEDDLMKLLVHSLSDLKSEFPYRDRRIPAHIVDTVERPGRSLKICVDDIIHMTKIPILLSDPMNLYRFSLENIHNKNRDNPTVSDVIILTSAIDMEIPEHGVLEPRPIALESPEIILAGELRDTIEAIGAACRVFRPSVVILHSPID